ncbi:hypothetical protein OAB74_00455 [Candidatus Pelagibacter sp.]|nr:hypothetical protein [Candidatus Pelagibacter sp.]
MLIRIILAFSLLLLISCSKPAVSINDCDGINKVSKEYIKCLENLVNSSNTATNLKEFGKHKTGVSFFKRVTVQPTK